MNDEGIQLTALKHCNSMDNTPTIYGMKNIIAFGREMLEIGKKEQ